MSFGFDAIYYSLEIIPLRLRIRRIIRKSKENIRNGGGGWVKRIV